MENNRIQTGIMMEDCELEVGRGSISANRMTFKNENLGRALRRWVQRENLTAPCKMPGRYRVIIERMPEEE